MKDTVRGLLTALIVILCWWISLVILLMTDLQQSHLGIIPLGLVVQTFLYTGLFITAHDAMHGTVFPRNRKFNDLIGTVAVLLYALFSYKNLMKKHWEHHRYPGTTRDPDFHAPGKPGFFFWYLRFMSNYLSWKQIIGMAILFNILLHAFKIPAINLIIFWIVPSLLSTLQLFYFGTFLPHRQLSEPFKDDHRARSNNFAVIWSFLSCFHFGYHWEHHEYPHVAWWKLPAMRRIFLANHQERR